MKYECKRCFYNTLLKSDMKRHLNRKIKCPRILESYKYNDKDLEELSLIPNKNKEDMKIELSNDKIFDNIKENIKLEDNIKNINNFDDILKYIKDNKCKKCFYCNLEFSRYYDLKRHITKNRKMFSINSKKVNNSNKYIQNNITNSILNKQNIVINIYNSSEKDSIVNDIINICNNSKIENIDNNIINIYSRSKTDNIINDILTEITNKDTLLSNNEIGY